MEYVICMDCDHCDVSRQNEQGQVRCTRFSRYVNRDDKGCDEFYVPLGQVLPGDRLLQLRAEELRIQNIERLNSRIRR